MRTPLLTTLILATALVFAAGCATAPTPDERFDQAQQAHDDGDVDRARMLAAASIELGKDTEQTRALLAETLRARAEQNMDDQLYERAYHGFLDAADNEPSAPRQAKDYARAIAAGEHDDVDAGRLRELVDKTLSLDPENTDWHHLAARLAEDRGDYNTAVEHYLWLYSASPEEFELAFQLAGAYLNADRPSDAASVLEQTLQRQPDDPDAGSKLADAYEELDFHEKAAQLHRDLAADAEERADHQAAIDHYGWLFSNDPSDATAGLRLGINYLAVDRPDDAAHALEQTLEHHPDNLQAGLNLTNAYQQLDRTDDAVDTFEQLLEHHPEHPGLLRRFAQLKAQLGEQQRARELEERAIEATPGLEQRDMRPLQ